MAKKLKQIAVLDKFNVLIGFEKVSVVKDGDVEVPENCDLDVNEKYRWDVNRKTFIPRGLLVGKIKSPPVPQETAIFLMMRALVKNEPIPEQCGKYVEWYEKNVKAHEDEVNSWRNKK